MGELVFCINLSGGGLDKIKLEIKFDFCCSLIRDIVIGNKVFCIIKIIGFCIIVFKKYCNCLV